MSEDLARRTVPDLLSGEQIRTGSPVDPKALIAIRWLALTGQFVALVAVAGIFEFAVPFAQAVGVILVGVAVNIFQSWRKWPADPSAPEGNSGCAYL